MSPPGFAAEPRPDADPLAESVRVAGGRLVPVEEAEGLVWYGSPDQLRELMPKAQRLRWVQLPSAGVESYRGIIEGELLWTAAKGVYADLVAEHVLVLALAGLRRIKERALARAWSEDGDGATLFGSKVVILGGGGIAGSLVRLLEPFGADITVVRRHPEPMPGVARVVGREGLLDALPGARLVAVTLALTPETEGIIGAAELRAMGPQAFLVNVARGRHVVTDDLVRSLRSEEIAGAGLDVTDPEPLPEGHPLWDLPNCIVTPHCANPHNLITGPLGLRVEENVRRYLAGEPLVGVVDPELGY